MLTIKAQTYYTTRGFTYSQLEIKLTNDSTVFNDNTIGTIIFGKKEGKDLIGISLDRETLFQGYIKTKDIIQQERGFSILYDFDSYYKGTIMPIKLLEVYTNSKARLPSVFLLIILNRFSNEPVRFLTFKDINKVK